MSDIFSRAHLFRFLLPPATGVAHTFLARTAQGGSSATKKERKTHLWSEKHRVEAEPQQKDASHSSGEHSTVQKLYRSERMQDTPRDGWARSGRRLPRPRRPVLPRRGRRPMRDRPPRPSACCPASPQPPPADSCGARAPHLPRQQAADVSIPCPTACTCHPG